MECDPLEIDALFLVIMIKFSQPKRTDSHSQWEKYSIAHPLSGRILEGHLWLVLDWGGASVYLLPKNIQRPLHPLDILVCETRLLRWVERLRDSLTQKEILGLMLSSLVDQLSVPKSLGKGPLDRGQARSHGVDQLPWFPDGI